MVDTATITNLILGGFIGYGTNDIAVRVIFRWILPRRKADIANKIQAVVSQELLTPEKIGDRFSSKETQDALKSAIRQWMDSFLDADQSYIELTADKRDQFAPIEKERLDSCVSSIFAWMAEDHFRQHTLLPSITRQWERLRTRTPAEIIPEFSQYINTVLMNIAQGLLHDPNKRQDIAQMLTAAAERRLQGAASLGDLIPESMQDILTQTAIEKSPLVADILASALEKDENKKAIVNLIAKAVEDSAKSMVPTEFLSNILGSAVRRLAVVEELVANLPNHIRDIPPYEFEAMLRPTLMEIWKEDWRSVLGDLNHDRLVTGFSTLINAFATDSISHEIHSGIAKYVDTMTSTKLEDIVKIIPTMRISADWQEALGLRIQELLTSSEVRAIIEGLIRSRAAILKATPLSEFGRYIDSDLRDRITDTAAEIVCDTVKTKLSDFAEQAKMWDIVGESINAYDNKALEKLIRSISKKELWWVNVGGGILGIIIALLKKFILG